MTPHNNLINRALVGGAALLMTTALTAPAFAIVSLQLFIEGANYETESQNSSDPDTWAKLGTDSFRLWVIADTSEYVRFRDVKFVASYADDLEPSLSFEASTTLGLVGFTDPSTSDANLVAADGIQLPTGPSPSPFEGLDFNAESWSHGGEQPVAGEGPLQTHGLLTEGRTAVEWNLGMFALIDSPIADFEIVVPGPTAHSGQINVYTVNVSGLLPGQQVHFDVYGVQQERTCLTSTGHGVSEICTGYSEWDNQPPSNPTPGNLALLNYVNAPYSHDARWEQDVPTPGTAALLLGGLGALGWFARRRETGLIGVAAMRRKRAA